MNKKEYMKPSVKVIALQHNCQLMAGSGDRYGINETLQTRDVDAVDEGW